MKLPSCSPGQGCCGAPGTRLRPASRGTPCTGGSLKMTLSTAAAPTAHTSKRVSTPPMHKRCARMQASAYQTAHISPHQHSQHTPALLQMPAAAACSPPHTRTVQHNLPVETHRFVPCCVATGLLLLSHVSIHTHPHTPCLSTHKCTHTHLRAHRSCRHCPVCTG